MCGIIGYTGKNEAKELLLEALEKLEYRGYDSSGMALCGGDEKGTRIYKCTGRVKNLQNLCGTKKENGTCGIGHTRWATHGGVSKENAHPHQFGKVTVVHNGIIENYKELISYYGLEKSLRSQTDSEVVAAVLSHFYKGDVCSAIRKTVLKLKGTFALGIMFEDMPGVIFAARHVSPVVITKTEDGTMLASDVTVLAQYAKEYFVLPEGHVAVLKKDKVSLYDMSGDMVKPEWQYVDWEVNCEGKSGYPFYMEKEIMEQPEVLKKTIQAHLKDKIADFEADGIPDSLLKECGHICVAACGTAMHAGLVAKALIQSLAGVPVEVEPASEFMYTDSIVDENTLVIAISQSGETIDTLEALKYAKRKGARSLAVVNVRASSIARESDCVIYTDAGAEIAVASTKAYTTQLAVLYLLCGRMAYVRGKLGGDEFSSYTAQLLKVPETVEAVLARKEEIHFIARKMLKAEDVFMIGRGLDYSVLLEGSLKLKEVSYIHSEAYAAGELKHGTIALITEDTPVVAVVTQDKLKAKEISNITEVRSRGAKIILFAKEDCQMTLGEDESIFLLPKLEDEFMVIPTSVALQLLAYYVSLDKGLDVDKPRNLAKVVTVE